MKLFLLLSFISANVHSVTPDRRSVLKIGALCIRALTGGSNASVTPPVKAVTMSSAEKKSLMANRVHTLQAILGDVHFGGHVGPVKEYGRRLSEIEFEVAAELGEPIGRVWDAVRIYYHQDDSKLLSDLLENADQADFVPPLYSHRFIESYEKRLETIYPEFVARNRTTSANERLMYLKAMVADYLSIFYTFTTRHVTLFSKIHRDEWLYLNDVSRGRCTEETEAPVYVKVLEELTELRTKFKKLESSPLVDLAPTLIDEIEQTTRLELLNLPERFRMVRNQVFEQQTSHLQYGKSIASPRFGYSSDGRIKDGAMAKRWAIHLRHVLAGMDGIDVFLSQLDRISGIADSELDQSTQQPSVLTYSPETTVTPLPDKIVEEVKVREY